MDNANTLKKLSRRYHCAVCEGYRGFSLTPEQQEQILKQFEKSDRPIIYFRDTHNEHTTFIQIDRNFDIRANNSGDPNIFDVSPVFANTNPEFISLPDPRAGSDSYKVKGRSGNY